MEDTMKAWFYYSWLEDEAEENKKIKTLGCLIGSFWNPQSAKEIMGEGVRTFESDEKGFEAAWKMVETSKYKKPKRKPTKKK